MGERTCSVAGCERPHYGRGWCSLHYARWFHHGDPMRVRPSFEQRFRAKHKVAENGCWVWNAALDEHGYGRCDNGNGGTTSASRMSYELYVGVVPAGMFVCHTCDNPPCVYPGHFFLGDQKANMQDALAKGRVRIGERHGMAKLTEEQVREIRRRWAIGDESRGMIARAFGVTSTTISDIATRRSWRHVA